MKSIKDAATGQNAREIAAWTQGSLLTVGKSLRSAGSSVCAGLKTGYDHLASEPTHREQVAFLKFGSLEALQGRAGAECRSCPALLLALHTGFQVWTLGDSVKEVVSRRDGSASCLEAVPLPGEEDMRRCTFLEDWPLVAVASEAKGAESQAQGLTVSTVRLYSLRRHTYIHTLTLPGRVLGLCCSRRVLLVAMVGQIMAYDTATMTVTYSAITQPAPVLRPGGQPEPGAVPLALGPRWLAHASNQAVQSASGVAVGQRIGSGSWGVGSSPRSGATNLDAVQHYAGLAAKTSGRHMKSLGEAGYKYLSSQVENWRGSGSHPPSSPSSSTTATQEDAEVEGTVIVRDMVRRNTLAHFRGHTSPLLLLRFDASGTLLITASVHGHTINVFHLCSPAAGGGQPGSALHLFRLSRGVTPAVIQDVGFSCSGEWLCVSSARGTTHVFRLSLPGKAEGTPPHLTAAAMPPAERREFRPVKLLAAGRARGASSVLNGSIPGSAAASAAVSLYNGSAGASQTRVASTFLPRHSDAVGSSLLPGPPPPGVQEDLLVITQEGALTRYRLHIPPPANPSTSHNNSQVPNGKKVEEGGGELAVEAVEQFEVCRKQSWPEREEAVFPDGEASEEEGEARQRLPWATYAETCLPYSGSPPPRIWADAQFQFLEMQDRQPSTGIGTDNLASSMLLVEDMPTKRVSLQSRAGLAPVKLEGAETAVLRGAHFVSRRQQGAS